MRKINLPDIPAPKGHYSQAVEHNGLIYVSGQLPVNHETGAVESGSIEAQTELALQNVEAVLKAAGSDLDSVLQMTIYVSEMNLWDRVNAVCISLFGEHKPARAVVPVKDLHFGTKIQIQAIAAVD